MIKSIYFIVFLLGSIYGQTFHIARIQYGGGGDWYCDPSSLPNLLSYLNNNTSISARKKGHIAPDCPRRQKGDGKGKGGKAKGKGKGVGKGKGKGKGKIGAPRDGSGCWECGGQHFSSQCLKQGKGAENQRETKETQRQPR